MDIKGHGIVLVECNYLPIYAMFCFPPYTLDIFPCNGGILLLGLSLGFNSCVEETPFVPPALCSFILQEMLLHLNVSWTL